MRRTCPLLGRKVVLRGLKSEAMNGKHGTAVDYGDARYTVRVALPADNGEVKTFRVKAENLVTRGQEA